MTLYMVMVADEDDRDKFIMPTSDDAAYMTMIARQTGTRVFCFRDKAQHLAMLKTLDLYHKKMAGNDKGVFYFAGPNPGLAKGKPAGMAMADYVYGKVSQFALSHCVKVLNPETC